MRPLPYWQFTLFGFPVRVHASFWVVMLLFGINSGDLLKGILFVAIAFVAVLAHELGHALAARHYGRSSSIELYAMGGKTTSTRYMLLSYPREILSSFSGPLMGFIVGGIVIVLQQLLGPVTGKYLIYFVYTLIQVNIGWGIINLLPILPLDGGNIMRSLYHWLRNQYDERIPLKISIGFGVFSIVAVLVYFRLSGLYLALLLGWLTYQNYLALKHGYRTDSYL